MKRGVRVEWVRKVWESMAAQPTGSPKMVGQVGGVELGEDLDRVPDEILVEIVRRAGPKTAARMCCLNSSWRSFLTSINSLWMHFLLHPAPSSSYAVLGDALFFAETHLRSGYPLDLSAATGNPISSLSLISIYSQRAQVPGSIVIDGGSGYCKFGWSKYSSPSGRPATFLEFGNIESPTYSRLRHFFATVFNRMQVKPSMHPVVLSLPLCHYDESDSSRAWRRQMKDAIYSVLFDMNVPAACALNQAVLALYVAQRTSGIVVNIGFHATHIVPILHGKVMRNVGVEVTSMSALKITGFLKDLMQQNNINFGSIYTVRTLKENLCYVARDYSAELTRNTKASFVVSGEGSFTLSSERFLAGEILFQPHLAGVSTNGLHIAVAQCLDRCYASNLCEETSWYRTIVLSGGTACLPGLAGRLENELHAMGLPSCHGVRVLPPPYGADTAWYGAHLISNLSTFVSSWCVTKKTYKRKSRFPLVW